MPALDFDLIIEQGADYALTIPVLDETGQPASVVGWTVAGQIRERAYSATILHTLTLVATVDGLALTIPGTTSAAWTWRFGCYDIKLTAPDSVATRILAGRVGVIPQVTR